jgi:hypothetical protein
MTRPSWSNYGTHDESATPALWAGVRAAYAPCLGPSGNRLHDLSRYNNWGNGSGFTLASAWSVFGGQYAADYTGSTWHSVTEFRCNREWTAAGWVRLTDAGYGVNLLGGLGRAQDGTNDYLLYVSGATTVNMWANQTPGVFNAGLTLTTADSFAVNTWNHFAWRVGVSSVDFYLNGKLQATSAAWPGVVRIGQIGARNGAVGWLGQISDLIFWDRTLPPNEIRELYDLGRGGMFYRRARQQRRYAPEQATGARRRRIITGMV